MVDYSSDPFQLSPEEIQLSEDVVSQIVCYEGEEDYRGTWPGAEGLEGYTRQVGSTGMPFSYGRTHLQSNRALTPIKARGLGADVGEMWRLAQSMGIVQQSLYDPIASICAAPWRIEAPALSPIFRTPEAEAVRQKHLRYCQWIWADWTSRGREDRGLVGYLGDVLRFALTCGFYLGELTGYFRSVTLDDGASFQTVLLPNPPRLRAPWSVDQWIWQGPDPLTGMVGIKQRALQQIDSKGQTGGYPFVPWRKLVHVPFFPISGNPDGTSLLRSSWAPLKMLQKFLQISALSAEVNGVGFISVHQDPQNPFTEADQQRIITQLKNYQGAQVPFCVLPPGLNHKIVWTTPSSTVANFSSQIADCERQVSWGINTSHKLVAVQGHGSFAARKQAGEEGKAGWGYLARTVAAYAVEVVFRRFLELNFPLDCARGWIFVPSVTDLAVETRDHQSFSATLATLAGAGLINPSDELENALKRALKLPVEESVSD